MKLTAYSERCSGCRACLLVCALTNHGLNNPKYGTISIHGRFPSPGGYEVNVCTRCGTCKDVCPVGAISEHPDGTYRVDPDICIGCCICVESCPEKVIRFVPEKNVAFSCVGCGECIKYCPKETLVDSDGEVKRA